MYSDRSCSPSPLDCSAWGLEQYSKHRTGQLAGQCTEGNLTDNDSTSFWLKFMQFESLVGRQISFITACWDPR